MSTRTIAALLVNRSLEIHQSLSMMGHIFYSNDNNDFSCQIIISSALEQ